MTTTDREWHEWRRNGIGASDIPAIMGVSPWASPYSVWAEKVGLIPPAEGTERMQIGKDAEGFLATVFTRHTGLYLAGEQTWCHHPTEPWMRCTPDAFVSEHPDRPDFLASLGGWEAKTSRDFGWPDGPPDVYRYQCQWQMAVTGMERVWLNVGFAGWRVETFEVERDARLIAEMILQADHFWLEHVCTGIAPPVDGSDATHDTLAFLFPDHVPGSSTEVDGATFAAWEAARQARLDHERQAKAAKDEEQRYANQLLADIEDAELATVDGVPVLSCRAQTRKGIDRDRLVADHPDIAEQYATSITYRVLRPASKKDRAA